MGKLFKSAIVLLLFSLGTLQADTMFMLTKMKKVYLVVENYSKKVPMSIKEDLYEELRYTTKELGIDTSGYSHRTLAVIMYETYIDSKITLNIDLVLGEEIKRLDDDKEVYGLTYEQRKQFFLEGLSTDEIEERIIDDVGLLLNNFMTQYQEDNAE